MEHIHWIMNQAQSNHTTPDNGLYPTADTTAFKFLYWCGAAGDAGR